MTESDIKTRIIWLQEKKAYNVNIGCLLVAKKFQREIDQLEKQLQQIEQEEGT